MRTWIEISHEAFTHNTAQIKQAIGDTQLALVVKSNAYGHGIQEIGWLANQEPSIEWLCTAGLQEAVMLRSYVPTKPIIALSYLDDDYEAAISKNIQCCIYDYATAYSLNTAAQRLGRKAYVHVKIDTGMSRLGISTSNAIQFIQALQQLPGIIVYGIFTHLGNTAHSDMSFSYHQLEQFDNLLDQLQDAGITISCTHALSSSSLALLPKRNYTLMRVGAALYGINKSLDYQERVRLLHPTFTIKPIMSWKTHILQIKTIAAGSYVGYNNSFQAEQPMRIALLPIGYWDGLSRALSNQGTVIVHQKNACIIGIISMNLTAIDITHIPETVINDEVTIISASDGTTLLDCAQKAGTIGNEVATRINHDIKRIIVSSHHDTVVIKKEHTDKDHCVKEL